MPRELPPGMAVGRHGVEAGKLALQLRVLCRDHSVNAIQDLPSEPFQEAMAIQSRIDALRTEQLETLKVLYQLSAPAILHEPTRRRFPLFVRMVLWIIGANDFMQLSTSEARGR